MHTHTRKAEFTVQYFNDVDYCDMQSAELSFVGGCGPSEKERKVVRYRYLHLTSFYFRFSNDFTLWRPI